MSSLADQMAGPRLDAPTLGAVRSWLTRLPLPASGPVADPAAVERGEAAFATVGCVECHAGPLGTDGLSHRVDGAAWQTPALAGVALRAPYLHDGRAPTLEAVLGTHDPQGGLFALGPREQDDLLAYLRAR